MRFAIVGSGSKGNCLLVEGNGTRLLIDCGYAPRELRKRVKALDVDVRTLNGLLITHGHSDHTKGARPLAGALGLVTYATEQTHRFLARTGGLVNLAPIVAGRPFDVGGLRVTPTATPHDAPGSVCFVVDDGDRRIGFVTDLGHPEPRVADALYGCDTLVVEHNHDPVMLRNGPYSERLKRRIASTHGHLSNDEGARLLSSCISQGTSRVLLAHLSEVNNTPALALAAAQPVCAPFDVELAIAPQHHATGWLRVRRSDPLGAGGVPIAYSMPPRAPLPPPPPAAAPAPRPAVPPPPPPPPRIVADAVRVVAVADLARAPVAAHQRSPLSSDAPTVAVARQLALFAAPSTPPTTMMRPGRTGTGDER